MVVRHSQVIKHGDKFQLSWLHTKRIMQNLCYISSSPARTAIERFWYLSFVKPGITCLQAKKHPAINLLNFVTDNDECAQNTHTCSLTSGVCKNTPGSFRCSCKPGFIGDGHNCEGLSICYRHLSNKLRCYRRISSPEKSRNSTREKISCYFFLTCVWYRQSAADTSLAFGATRSGWWKNGVQTFPEKGRKAKYGKKNRKIRIQWLWWWNFSRGSERKSTTGRFATGRLWPSIREFCTSEIMPWFVFVMFQRIFHVEP